MNDRHRNTTQMLNNVVSDNDVHTLRMSAWKVDAGYDSHAHLCIIVDFLISKARAVRDGTLHRLIQGSEQIYTLTQRIS